ncbi:MAG: tripartite tricarboxylate transporter permease [Nanoarchaeota archaeon]
MAELISLTIALVFGIFAGIITGLIPGIHTNTVAALVLASLALLTKYFSPLALGIFLISMVVVHSFVDFIPSIFLGAPEAETALGVLPGHKLLLEGHGYRALKLTVIGGLGSFTIGLLLLPLFSFFVEHGYIFLEKLIAPIVISISAYFIFMENSKSKIIWSFLVAILAGVLGIITLNDLSIKEPLFPLLSGLFGVSTLIISMKDNAKIPLQIIDENVPFLNLRNFKNYIKSILSSSIMSVLPALGAAQATILAQSLTKEKHHEDFLVIVGGINTASALFVLSTLWLIGRARTGVIAALDQFLILDLGSYMLLIVVSIAAAVIGAYLTLTLGKFLANKIAKINYNKFSIIIILFLIALTAIISGAIGLLVLSIATSIGLIAPLVGIKRVHAMSVIAFPVVLYFI